MKVILPRHHNLRNWILRLIVGGAFVVAGALKIAGPAKFAVDVSNYRLVPHELINLVAILVPWIEVTAGAFVLAGIWLRTAALVITSLTVMFFAVIVSALADWSISRLTPRSFSSRRYWPDDPRIIRRRKSSGKPVRRTLRHYFRLHRRPVRQSSAGHIHSCVVRVVGQKTPDAEGAGCRTQFTFNQPPSAAGKSPLTSLQSPPTIRKWPQTLGKSAATPAAPRPGRIAD
jgi:uncharacterized membrane protein YphA (DoxX/SURF4 family)